MGTKSSVCRLSCPQTTRRDARGDRTAGDRHPDRPAGRDDDLALRVYVTPGGCSGFSYGMTFAEGNEEDDQLIEQDGVRIVVDPMSAMYLKGSEIDFVDALMGGGFALRNPNAVSSCGCGQSFRTAEQTGTAKACNH